MPRPALPGIFCLEGEWDPDLRRRKSVLPILELLERLDVARTIHRDVATRDELAFYLAKWGQKRYRDCEVLHLACHTEMSAASSWAGTRWPWRSLRGSSRASARGGSSISRRA